MTRFLQTLFGMLSEGFFTIWAKRKDGTKITHWYDVAVGDGVLKQAAEKALELDAQGYDVYVSTCLARTTGKTTFANAGGNTLFIATEDGQGGLDAYRVAVDSWDTFLQVVAELKTASVSYDKVCIDTVDNLYKFCAEWACTKLGVVHQSDASYGKGSDTINSEFLRQLTTLSLLPFGLWMISHAQEKEIKPRAGAAYTVITPTLPPAARKIVLGTCRRPASVPL